MSYFFKTRCILENHLLYFKPNGEYNIVGTVNEVILWILIYFANFIITRIIIK